MPVVILLIMAIPAAETLVKLEDSRDPDITIVITGYQWRWHYKYQDEDLEFYSSLATPSLEARSKQSGIDPRTVDNYLLEVDHPVVVPVGAKVRLLMTSNDVVHSWWVPDLAIKKDAVPGMVNEVMVPRQTKPAPSAASAPSCAAVATAICRLSSRWWRPMPTRPGSIRAPRQDAQLANAQ